MSDYRGVRLALAVFSLFLIAPAAAFAQASITGVVRGIVKRSESTRASHRPPRGCP